MCGAEAGVPCRDRFVHTGRRFDIGLCWPGMHLGDRAPLLLDRRCRATVETTYAWDFTRQGRHDIATREAIVSRGACTGCGWAGTQEHRNGSNPAIEDALDHALAGWRLVPVVEPCRPDASSKQTAQWLEQIAVLYDALDLDACLAPSHGGVIRTRRRLYGTRSHFSTGFYNICAEIIDDPDTEPLSTLTEQLGLF